VLHGVDLFRVQMIRNLLEPSRINAVRLFKHKPCRTAVDLFRPSMTYLWCGTDVDGRNERGHDALRCCSHLNPNEIRSSQIRN